MRSQWRITAAPIIQKVLEEKLGADEKTIRAALRQAYPFGVRKHYPYKVWCDEIQRQRRLQRLTARAAYGKPLPGQLKLPIAMRDQLDLALPGDEDECATS